MIMEIPMVGYIIHYARVLMAKKNIKQSDSELQEQHFNLHSTVNCFQILITFYSITYKIVLSLTPTLFR